MVWVVWLGLGFGVARVLLVGQTVPDQYMLVLPNDLRIGIEVGGGEGGGRDGGRERETETRMVCKQNPPTSRKHEGRLFAGSVAAR